MAQRGIEPEKVTKPIQLVAAWFATLVLLVSAFLTASTTANDPSWLPILYGAAAVAAVPFFALFVFRLQTRYRPQLLEDKYFVKAQAERQQLTGFKDENLPGAEPPAATPASESELPEVRKRLYESRRGLFVVHTWLPSEGRAGWADISVRLHEHGGEAGTPLSDGDVDRVDYYLGRSFFGGNVVTKENADQQFRLDVSAYGTTNCVARVFFKDGSHVDMDRYLDFVT
jgi:hypothetical protein